MSVSPDSSSTVSQSDPSSHILSSKWPLENPFLIVLGGAVGILLVGSLAWFWRNIPGGDLIQLLRVPFGLAPVVVASKSITTIPFDGNILAISAAAVIFMITLLYMLHMLVRLWESGSKVGAGDIVFGVFYLVVIGFVILMGTRLRTGAGYPVSSFAVLGAFIGGTGLLLSPIRGQDVQMSATGSILGLRAGLLLGAGILFMTGRLDGLIIGAIGSYALGSVVYTTISWVLESRGYKGEIGVVHISTNTLAVIAIIIGFINGAFTGSAITIIARFDTGRLVGSTNGIILALTRLSINVIFAHIASIQIVLSSVMGRFYRTDPNAPPKRGVANRISLTKQGVERLKIANRSALLTTAVLLVVWIALHILNVA